MMGACALPPKKDVVCRDTAKGFNNPHINECGFAIAACYVADNMARALRKGLEPLLEDELVIGV